MCSRWWSSDGVGEAWDFAEIFEFAAAVLTGEGLWLGGIRWDFGGLVKEVTHSLPGLLCGAGLEAVVADPGEAFGQDVEKPAANEFVRVKAED